MKGKLLTRNLRYRCNELFRGDDLLRRELVKLDVEIGNTLSGRVSAFFNTYIYHGE